jgi:hypothetical protein
MARILTGLLLALTLGLSAVPAGAAFENVDISPRARAMGDEQVAIADDAYAPYFNPAGLGRATQSSLGASYLRPYGLSFTDLIYVGGVIPLSARYGGVGFGVRRFAVDWDHKDPVTGVVENTDLLEESTYTVSHGLRLYEDMHSTVMFGSALNVYHLRFGPTVGADGWGEGGIDPGGATVVGLDAAMLVVLRERTRLGVLVKNLNNPQIGLDNEEIKQRVHGGIAYEPYVGVVTTFEIENVLGEQVQYHGGMEVRLYEGLDLRFGTMTQPNKLTAGFGYQRQGFAFNYGFSTGGGVLDSTHHFGLTFTWGGETP